MAHKKNISGKYNSDNMARPRDKEESNLPMFGSPVFTFFSRFQRFGNEVVGVLLLMLTAITVFSIIGLTSGVWVTVWANLLGQWFGVGKYLVVVIMGWGGYWLVTSGSVDIKTVRWGRVVSLELALFALLGVLSVVGSAIFSANTPLARTELGKDGGLIGWGIAEVFYMILSSVLPTWLANWVVPIALIGIVYFGLRYAFPDISISTVGIVRKGIAAIPNLQAEDAAESELYSSAIQAELPLKTKKKTAARKKQANIPAKFRKKFLFEKSSEVIEELPERDYRLPPLDRLADEKTIRPSESQINRTAGMIEKTLAEFGVPSKVVDFQVGPTITRFAIEPGYIEKPGRDGKLVRQKIRVSKISALQSDLALALSAQRLRIQAPVPGRSFVGIEVPNLQSNIVRLRPILESEKFYNAKSSLALALGRDVSGQIVIADLAKMPHLLIAGTTGSGKSVCISAITICLAMNNTPDDLKLVMIDPKMVELVPFNGLPHLIGKVETDLNRISAVLRWVVMEMDKRYKQFEEVHARDLDSYNQKIRRKRDKKHLPRIVVLIDELADLMMNASEHTEATLVRLAQMGRATGIHLVVATQRPSTDVVTGLIKANFPARLSFAVASGTDSRVILDEAGAETLLGRGDMLFLSPEAGSAIRSQGVMISDQEIENVISYWQKTWQAEGEQESPWEALMMLDNEREGRDELLDRAIEVLRETGKASASHLQRKLRIGYPRAARLMDELEDIGIVGPTRGGGREREVLLDFDENVDEQL